MARKYQTTGTGNQNDKDAWEELYQEQVKNFGGDPGEITDHGDGRKSVAWSEKLGVRDPVTGQMGNGRVGTSIGPIAKYTAPQTSTSTPPPPRPQTTPPPTPTKAPPPQASSTTTPPPAPIGAPTPVPAPPVSLPPTPGGGGGTVQQAPTSPAVSGLMGAAPMGGMGGEISIPGAGAIRALGKRMYPPETGALAGLKRAY